MESKRDRELVAVERGGWRYGKVQENYSRKNEHEEVSTPISTPAPTTCSCRIAFGSQLLLLCLRPEIQSPGDLGMP